MPVTMPSKAPLVEHTANHFEDFEIGQVFRHHWGHTFESAHGTEFASQFMLYETRLRNSRYAEALGYDAIPMSLLYVFSVVLGMSVEDLSESGGPFLGADNIRSHAPVFAGDTVFASSIVLEMRDSRSRPRYGITRWRTEGVNQDGDRVVSFERANLVRRRGGAVKDGEWA